MFDGRQSSRLCDLPNVLGGGLNDDGVGKQLPNTTVRRLLNWLVISGRHICLRKARHNLNRTTGRLAGPFSLGSESMTWIQVIPLAEVEIPEQISTNLCRGANVLRMEHTLRCG